MEKEQKEQTVIIIQKPFVKIETKRSEIVSVDPTGDGIAFTFKNGMSFLVTDQHMPPATKSSIKKSLDLYNNATEISINLNNYLKPLNVII